MESSISPGLAIEIELSVSPGLRVHAHCTSLGLNETRKDRVRGVKRCLEVHSFLWLVRYGHTFMGVLLPVRRRACCRVGGLRLP